MPLLYFAYLILNGIIFDPIITKIQEKLGLIGEDADEAHSTDFYKEIHINPLTDLNNKASLELENFKPFETTDFSKYRYPEEMVLSNEYYKGSLEKKVKDIEEMIDSHLIFLKGQTDFEVNWK